MRIKLSGLLMLVLFVLALTLSASAQQAQTESVEELTAAIQKLEAIDRRPETPAEIKELNRTFLLEKRAKLLPLLVQKREMRRAYLSDATSALSTDQILKVEQEMSALDSRIKQLQSTLQATQVNAAGTQVNASSATETSSATAAPVNPTASVTNENAASSVAGSEPGNASNASAVAPANTTTSTPANAATVNNSSTTAAAALNTGGQGTTNTTTTGDATKPLTTAESFRLRLAGTAEQIRNAKATNPRATLNLQQNFFLFALALAAPKVEATRQAVVAEFTSQAENVKTDKQTGASQGTGSTTSLVTKAGIPAIFGFAVENGALTRTDSKNGVTFSGTPVGIFEALAKKGFIDSYQQDDSFDRFLRNFSFKLTFDTSRGSSAGTFTGDKQQLSGYSLRYKFIDQRDPRDAKYTNQWSALVENEGLRVTNVLARIFTGFFLRPTPAFTEWRKTAEEAIASAAPADVERVLSEQLDKLKTTDLGPEVNNLISSFGTEFDSFLKRRDDILNQVNSGWVSTLEYNNERRVALPSVSNIRFIAEKGAYGGSLDLTANASLTFLNSRPAGSTQNRLRDVRLSGQLDVPLGNVATTGKFLLSFAGHFERLMDDETLSNGLVMAPKGNIGVGQIKLTIPIRGTAFKIPLSFSFANRTELVKEKEVRGNFGFTFDLDSIFAKFNPFNQK